MTQAEEKLEKLYSVKDTAEYLKLSEESIRQRFRQGILTGVKIGRKIMFAQSDINDYLERCKTANREN